MKGFIKRAAATALVGALATGVALADLTAMEKVQILEVKAKVQEVKMEAARLKDAAKSQEAKDLAQQVVQTLDDIHAILEDILRND